MIASYPCPRAQRAPLDCLASLGPTQVQDTQLAYRRLVILRPPRQEGLDRNTFSASVAHPNTLSWRSLSEALIILAVAGYVEIAGGVSALTGLPR